MPIATNTERKRYSNYVVSTQRNVLDNQCSKRVTVKNTTSVVVDPIGLPVIWDDTDAFEFYTSTSDISALTTEPDGLGGAKVGIVVGSSEGEGVNTDDITVTSAGVELTVLFRDATVIADSIDYSVFDVDGVAVVTPASGDVITAFTNQLEKQRVNAVAEAQVVSPSYVN